MKCEAPQSLHYKYRELFRFVKAFLTAGTSVRKLDIQSLSSPPGPGYFTGWDLELQRSERERFCWRHISFGNNLAEVSSRRYRRRCGGRVQSRRCTSSDICDHMQRSNRKVPVMTDATLLPSFLPSPSRNRLNLSSITRRGARKK